MNHASGLRSCCADRNSPRTSLFGSRCEIGLQTKRGKTREARTLLCQSSTPEEAEEVFRWMYDNLDLWGKTPEQQDQAIVIIRNGLVNHNSVADIEINLSATLIELGQIQ